MTSQQTLYEIYEVEICNVNKQADTFLQGIRVFEADLHERKQRKGKIDQHDLKTLQGMILKFLRMLALIQTYQYYQSKDLQITDTDWFFYIAHSCFSNRLDWFISDLRARVIKSRVEDILND